jgi:hypothetical protein
MALTAVDIGHQRGGGIVRLDRSCKIDPATIFAE